MAYISDMLMGTDIFAIAPVVAVFAAYIVLAVLLNLAAQPMRRRMVRQAMAMLDEPHWSASERLFIEGMLDSCLSTRVAMLLPFAYIAAAMDAVLGVMKPDKDIVRVQRDRRFPLLTMRYFLSVMAANPLLAAISLIPALLNVASQLMLSSKSLRSSIEDPIYRASLSPRAVR